ncbi:MAG: hypothetical protein ACFBSG_11905 [Leptolyngbyaceae cyanobacterium]
MSANLTPSHSRSPAARPLVKAAGHSTEAGLTLVECIMAIVVVGITGAAIAPMMVASVATRVQSQRSEQALELAQSEIDRVRVQFEQQNNFANLTNLPEIVTVAGDRAPSVAGPTGLSDTATTLREVDIDQDSDFDFVVQSYLVQKGNINRAYEMGVRVYQHDAVDGATGALATDEAQLGMSNSTGERREKPLAALYSNLSLIENSESLCNLIDYTDTSGTPVKPPACN